MIDKIDSKSSKKINISVICWVLSILVIVITPFVVGISIKVAASKAKQNYDDTVKEVSDYMNIEAYNMAEQNNHVSNRISVEIESLIEDAKLEVLTVRDVEFITDETDEKGNITSWLQVEGEGSFTVDLKVAEYLYDATRDTITIILPYPELTYCRLRNGDCILYEDSRFIGDGSYSEGENLAQRQIQNGYIAVYDYFLSNAQFLKSAKNSAEQLMTNFVQQLYPDNYEMEINVVFRERE
ncbi:MAG: DUF4230 domain-containing protein [Solobacterium sp.]|nr:DUF4230 domain-containing protein [Solobacterium sp.]